MQDNSKNSYNPELVDQGWLLLEKQLDEVLPQKPKRRFAWFWLPLLLGFGILAGAGWYGFNLSPSVDATQSRPLAPEVLNTPIASNEVSQATQVEDISAASMPGVTRQNVEQPTDKQQASQSNNLLAGGGQSNTQASGQFAEHSTIIEDQTSEADVVEQQGVTEEAITEPKLSDEQKNSNTDVLFERNRQLIAVLPSSDLKFLPVADPVSNLDAVSTKVKNNNWRIYAEGQATLALGPQAGLSGIGVGVEYRLKKDWRLSLGVTYEQSEQILSTRELAYNITEAELDIQNGAYTPTYNINETYDRLSYQRLKTDLHLAYQLAPRWRIGAGLNIAYYTQAIFSLNLDRNIEFVGVTIDETSNERDIFSEEISVYEYDTNSNAASASYTLAPNRWQLAGALNVQYQISPRWATNLAYRRDLTKWQTEVTDIGTPSFLQFGLRYYIK